MEITFKLTADEADTLIRAAPAACRYWAGDVGRSGSTLIVYGDEQEGSPTTQRISKASLARGLAFALLNSVCVAEQFAQWKGSVRERLEALDQAAVDIVIQYAAFGEQRYG